MYATIKLIKMQFGPWLPMTISQQLTICLPDAVAHDTVALPYAMGLKSLANSEKPLQRLGSTCGCFSVLAQGFNPVRRQYNRVIQ